jgi:hypothetical protein
MKTFTTFDECVNAYIAQGHDFNAVQSATYNFDGSYAGSSFNGVYFKSNREAYIACMKLHGFVISE